MNKPIKQMHKCASCGFEWEHGQFGGHSCVTWLNAQLADAKRNAELAYEELRGTSVLLNQAKGHIDELRGWVRVLSEALENHQAQTRPIAGTIEAIAAVKGEQADVGYVVFTEPNEASKYEGCD